LRRRVSETLVRIKLPDQATEAKAVSDSPCETLAIMEVTGGPLLRAVLRQLSTAASIRTVPTPCRARPQGAQAAGFETPPPRGVFFREANHTWGDRVADAGLEVWDLDDGFTLPPPLLDPSVGGALDEILSEIDFSTPGGVLSPLSTEVAYEESTSNEIMNQILAALENHQGRCGSHPLGAAVLAGGRRFPAARAGPRVSQAAKAGSGRCLRPTLRQQRRGGGAQRGFTRVGRENIPHGR